MTQNLQTPKRAVANPPTIGRKSRSLPNHADAESGAAAAADAGPAAHHARSGFTVRFKQLLNAPRKFIDAYRQHLGILSIVALILSSIVLGRALTAPERKPIVAAYAWYFDLNNGQLFVDDAGKPTPIPAPSGNTLENKPAGVLAYVFTCGSCDNPADRFVGYLEETPENGDVSPEAALVTMVNGTKWVERTSPQAEALIASFNGRCRGGVAPDQCMPNSR